MKEFIMKHPIITFLLADALLTGLFNTIRAFAPNQAAVSSGEEEKQDDAEGELIQHIDSKEETA